METNDNDEINKVELRKIPLANFIDILTQLYDEGADYVDIIGKPNDFQDIMQLVVREEYVDREAAAAAMEDNYVEQPAPLNTINLNDLV